MSSEIDAKIKKAKKALGKIGYNPDDVSAREFYDYMTGEIFSDDPTTLQDVLNNEYITIHEVVEISELKRTGRKIDKKVIMETPRALLYTAHFIAIQTELEYALHKRDTYWARIRLYQHKESVLDDDPNLPEEMRPKAESLYKKYHKLVQKMASQPVTM